MAPSKDQTYTPVPPIPTYDEAVASGSHSAYEADRLDHPSPTIENDVPGQESHSLLSRSHHRTHSTSSETARGGQSRRRNNGYRAPTVETDDEDSNWASDDDGDDEEALHVRREMEEMDMVDPATDRRNLSSLFRKRIPFSISLPQWKWSFRLPKWRIRLPSRAPSEQGSDAPQRRFQCPSINSPATFLLVARLLAIFLILGFVYLLFMSDLFTNMSRRLNGQVFDPESVRLHVQSTVKPDKMRETLKHFTSYAHLAGTEGDYALALDVSSMFGEYGLEDVMVDEYHVYLNYPKKDGRAVELLDKDGKASWAAKIEEEEVGEESAGRQTFAFHGHSKSGDVRGPLIYANYGSREDFKKLKDAGIDTKGSIALIRYYGPGGDRALKVKAAEMAGCAGAILYSDPADDGFLKGDPVPKGRFMPEDGVQRGSVSLMNWIVGDPLTPGWESKKGLPRVEPGESKGLVQIPSIPLAWRDAKVLLQHLKGVGQKVAEGWMGGVPDVDEWWTGGPSSPIVRLKNEQDEVKQQPIWNVYGRVIGSEQPSKSIIIGNHRDAWTEGATDPGSGTAIFLEMARIFGDLLYRGWRPRRTIEFMSWDAQGYNMIGSTEYVENNLATLRDSAYAYINIDSAIIGDQFSASGSPVFKRLLLQILNRVGDPNYNATLRDRWTERNGELDPLGLASDYVPWQTIAGTSAIDLSFSGDRFAYHSNYDTFNLMDAVIDPGFTYHDMMGQVLGLLIIELADEPVVPFDMSFYGSSLQKWVGELISWAEEKGANKDGKNSVGLAALKSSADTVAAAIREFTAWEDEWEREIVSSGGWEAVSLTKRRLEYNNRMGKFETDLLDLGADGGFPDRPQFKHSVFGPQLWSGYDATLFPLVRDYIEAGDWDNANKTVARYADLLRTAAGNLIA